MFRSFLSTLTLLAVGVMLLAVVAEMPAFGSDHKPSDNELSERILTQVVEDTGAPNAVTAIILDYRAYDTLLEASVLFVSVVATLAAFAVRRWREEGEADG